MTLFFEKIHLLERIGIPLDGISITMNDLNIERIDRGFILFLKSLGFTGLATDIDLVGCANSSHDVSYYVNHMLEIYDNCMELGIENFGSWTKPFTNLVNQEDGCLMSYCRAQKGHNISVNPEGNMFLCGYSTSSICNLDDVDIETVPSGYLSLVTNKLPGNNPRCVGCFLEGSCAGQCLVTHEFSVKNKTEERVIFLCDFFKRCFKGLMHRKLNREIGGAITPLFV